MIKLIPGLTVTFSLAVVAIFLSNLEIIQSTVNFSPLIIAISKENPKSCNCIFRI